VRALFLLVAALEAGCLIDTVPLPEGEPGENPPPPPVRDDTGFPGADPGACPNLVCTPGDLDGVGEGGGRASLEPSLLFHVTTASGLLVAGAPYATPGAGVVNLIDRPRFIAVAAPTRADGSFVATLGGAHLGDTLEVRFYANEQLVDATTAALREPSYATYEANSDLAAAFANAAAGAEAPASDVAELAAGASVATLTGAIASFNPAIVVVAVNPARSAVGRARATDDGAFSLTVPAASGETLLVFAVEPAYSNGAAEPLELTAP
jgi:hypothetical protein